MDLVPQTWVSSFKNFLRRREKKLQKKKWNWRGDPSLCSPLFIKLYSSCSTPPFFFTFLSTSGFVHIVYEERIRWAAQQVRARIFLKDAPVQWTFFSSIFKYLSSEYNSRWCTYTPKSEVDRRKKYSARVCFSRDFRQFLFFSLSRHVFKYDNS